MVLIGTIHSVCKAMRAPFQSVFELQDGQGCPRLFSVTVHSSVIQPVQCPQWGQVNLIMPLPASATCIRLTGGVGGMSDLSKSTGYSSPQ